MDTFRQEDVQKFKEDAIEIARNMINKIKTLNPKFTEGNITDSQDYKIFVADDNNCNNEGAGEEQEEQQEEQEAQQEEQEE